METLTALKVAHVLATVLLLAGAAGLAIWVWRARRGGDATAHTRTLQRPLVFIWLLMGLALASMPFTGWWMVHQVGWPLGQTWLLASSVLYTAATLAGFWLLVRLNRLRTLPAAGNGKFTLALALFSVVCFIAIAGLMGAKPV
ncbi:Uncharacterized membrane protein [Pseudomonas sp. NFACC32-1]|jgi:uncharacterized membrane protein|uniref:DUF2269 family protein n=1 Tax=unclassified Pseudomonas TaxID=196821 RepID=UPI00087603D4|nr:MULTISPECIES: DUF2269 family protein [unclassified Pseudomonas]MDB6444928.1 DUF2269 family protein [Pseudomonas sp. 21TX0197]ROO32184.1 hypothetical protein BIV09_25910 [Pseudomonas sp. 7SR1]ROO34448.1 hypothetical protein BIV08_06030 [Pseudomonas sp. AF76]SCX69684.1 Uncharacterized membrane protein [Pseudomonas sp. NFACC32-1]SFW79675.1 Uncharacterized membrane protein [Pseudomonas sp. NFACC09-4]